MSRTEGNVTVIDHPLIQHKLTIMRNKETSIAGFRRLLRAHTCAHRGVPTLSRHSPVATQARGTRAPPTARPVFPSTGRPIYESPNAT